MSNTNLNTAEILLVEDNMSDAELITRELKKNNLGNNLVHVKNGDEAIEFLFGTGKYAVIRDLAYQPRLILMDLQMPKINGIEVLAKIKSAPLTKHIPVVMLSSSRENTDISRCYALGVNSYIVKPVNFESFAESISKLSEYWLLLNQAPH